MSDTNREAVASLLRLKSALIGAEESLSYARAEHDQLAALLQPAPQEPPEPGAWRYFRGKGREVFRVRATGTDEVWAGDSWDDTLDPWTLEGWLERVEESNALELTEREALALTERKQEPKPEPPVEPPPRTRPRQGAHGQVSGTETDGAYRISWRANTLPEASGALGPRTCRAYFTGDMRAWSEYAAERAWGDKRHELAKRLPMQAKMLAESKGTTVEINGVLYAFADDRAGNGQGGVGIPRDRWSWRLNADGLRLAMLEAIGAVNRCPIAFSTEYATPGQAHSLHRQHPMPGYPDYPQITDDPATWRPFDHSHLSRAWSAAAFLRRHCPWLQFPVWWMDMLSDELHYALGDHVITEGGWSEVGAAQSGKSPDWAARSHNAPLWRRMEWLDEAPYTGWFGRDWAHPARFWLAHDPEGKNRGRMDDLLHKILDRHPDKDARNGILQWGRGQTYDALPKSERDRGRWGQSFEAALVLIELEVYGFLLDAADAADWLGPYAWGVTLLDEPAKPRGMPAWYRYGGGNLKADPAAHGASWIDPWRGGDELNRMPLMRYSMPLEGEGAPTVADLLADDAAQTWALEDRPLDYARPEMVAEILGWEP